MYAICIELQIQKSYNVGSYENKYYESYDFVYELQYIRNLLAHKQYYATCFFY